MRKTILLLFIMLALTANNAMASDGPLKIAIEGQYPPFNYVDQQGTPKGFEIDLAQELCKIIGREYKFVVLDWDGIIPGLLARRVDMIMASMSITGERKKSVAFTRKYYEENGSYVTRKGSGLVVSKEGLKGKNVGVQRSTNWSSYIENTYPEANVVYYNDDNMGLLDLLAGRIDTYLAQSYFMSQWIKKPEASELEITGAPVRDSKYIGEGIGIAVRKNETELQKQLNDAIATILKNGTYERIASRYFDFDIYGHGM